MYSVENSMFFSLKKQRKIEKLYKTLLSGGEIFKKTEKGRGFVFIYFEGASNLAFIYQDLVTFVRKFQYLYIFEKDNLKTLYFD